MNIGWRRGQPPRSDVVVKLSHDNAAARVTNKILVKNHYFKTIYRIGHLYCFEMTNIMNRNVMCILKGIAQSVDFTRMGMP